MPTQTAYRALWGGRVNRSHFLQLEPDQAGERCLKLLQHGHPFVVEIDPTKIKDMVVLSIGAAFEEEPNKDYISQRAVGSYDDAAQYALNLIRAELSFAVEPQQMPDTERKEWRFTVQLPKR